MINDDDNEKKAYTIIAITSTTKSTIYVYINVYKFGGCVCGGVTK